MSSLTILLRKHVELAQQQTKIEQQLVEVERQINEVVSAPRPRAKRSTRAEMVEVVRDVVKVLREASEPLPRAEIASRLGINGWQTNYRLTKAMKLGFVERVSMGRYRASDAVKGI